MKADGCALLPNTCSEGGCQGFFTLYRLNSPSCAGGGATAVERLEIHGCIVWRAILPTSIEDADPFEGQGAYGRLVRLALGALLLVVDLGPEGMAGGFSLPLHKHLAQKLGTLETPVDPGLLAAAFRHWRNTRIFLECVGGGKAFPLFAEGNEEAGAKTAPAPGKASNNGKSGWS